MKTKAAITMLLALLFLAAGTAAAQTGFPEDCLAIPEIMPDHHPGYRQPMDRQPMDRGTSPEADTRSAPKLAADDSPPVKVCPTDSAVASLAPQTAGRR